MPPKHRYLDLAAIAICTLAWGTTWFAITLQLGYVDPVVSLAYRFALAALVLFAWCGIRREPLRMTVAQHRSACGIGFFTFTIDYTFIYLAEARISSAVVAVTFATLSLLNLITFRIVFKQRAALTAWIAAGLGAAGVALLCWSEIFSTHVGTQAGIGFGMTCIAVLAAAIGNISARRGEAAGAPVAALTVWAMVYGTMLLSLYALLTGRAWKFDVSVAYVASLAYLAIVGSVVAFLFYYGLARRRGYASAAYITALTPPIAMGISTVLEGKRWGILAFAGLSLVLFGQWLLLRTRRP